MTCNQFTSEDYALYALGTLDDSVRVHLNAHLRSGCETCLNEMKAAVELWYIFAALTEQTQLHTFPEPSPLLRDRVRAIGHQDRSAGPRRVSMLKPSPLKSWMRIAAAVLVTSGALGFSWSLDRTGMKKDVLASENRLEREMSAVKKLESENDSLKNLVVAVRNAPAVFPGKESIVSVQDPYILRDLQLARQTQAAMADALNEERRKSSDLEKRLSQTTTLLAAATRESENAERQYRKAVDAVLVEKESGANQVSAALASYKSRIQDLESQVVRFRTLLDSQKKGFEQHTQMISLLQSPSVSLVQLRGTEAGQNAAGVALIADNSRVAFFPSNMPDAPSGRTYQLWLIRDKGKAIVSAGTFTAARKDSATLQFGDKALLTGIKAFAVTEEPAGGSALPTGHKVMIGTFKG